MLLGDELAAELGVPLGPEEERYGRELLAAESLPEVEDASRTIGNASTGS
jgi:hypothetical protein